MILSQSKSVVIRAPRFPVEMFVRFRGNREPAWHEGRTENISRSGVLLRCDLKMEIEAPVEMGFILPAEILGRPCGEVECRGIVARVEPPAKGRREARVAVTISDYRFVREKERAWAASRYSRSHALNATGPVIAQSEGDQRIMRCTPKSLHLSCDF